MKSLQYFSYIKILSFKNIIKIKILKKEKLFFLTFHNASQQSGLQISDAVQNKTTTLSRALLIWGELRNYSILDWDFVRNNFDGILLLRKKLVLAQFQLPLVKVMRSLVHFSTAQQ